MENNAFFGTVLRSLGYEVTSVGARVCMGVNGGDRSGYGSWYVLWPPTWVRHCVWHAQSKTIRKDLEMLTQNVPWGGGKKGPTW